MRVACILINNIPVQVVLSSNPDLRGEPLIIGGLPFEGKSVCDASPEAMAHGIRPGMSLRDAYALCPNATFLPSDKRRYDESFEKVINVLRNFSPVVDVERPGSAYIDATGISNEQEFANDVVGSISSETGLNPSLGIGNSRFISRVAAFTSGSGTSSVVPQGREEGFVTPFSIDFLPCSDETRERLYLFGIRFIGQLSRFSREALVTQCASEGVMLYELSHGIDRTPLTPTKKPEVTVTTELEPPATIYLQILHVCQVMLEKPLDKVRAQGKVCHEILVKTVFASGVSQEKRLPLKEHTLSVSVILDRLRTWLESITFPAPVIRVEISLLLARETGKSLRLWPEHQRAGKLPIKLANELRTRFGYQPLKRIEVAESGAILPERRFRLVDLLEEETEDR